MSHKNYHEFYADSHYDLGLKMGEAFADKAQEAIAEAKKDHWEQRIAIGKQQFEVTKKYFPDYISEIEGYSKGAQIDFMDLWTINIESDAFLEEGAKCTNLVTNFGKLIGHNEDADEPGYENNVCVVKKTINDLTILEIYYYNTLGGNSVGVNSFGFAQSLNTLLFTETTIGVPKNVIGRFLSDTKNPENDINTVLTIPRASGYNHNIINTKGEIWNLELTNLNGHLTKPKSPFVHSNHRLSTSTTYPDDYGTISRLKYFQENVKQHMSAEEVIAIQENSSLGSNLSVFNERTIGKMLIDFDQMETRIWLLREKELGWVSYSLDFIDI